MFPFYTIFINSTKKSLSLFHSKNIENDRNNAVCLKDWWDKHRQKGTAETKIGNTV